MPLIADDELRQRLQSIKLHIQRGLEHLDKRQDVSEGQRLLIIADRELMLLLRKLDGGQG
jgi:hypothetical protein